MISQHGPYRQCNGKYNDQDQDQINCFHKPVITSVFDSYPSCPVTSGPGKVNAFSGMSYDRPYEMNDHGEDPGNGALPDNHGGSPSDPELTVNGGNCRHTGSVEEGEDQQAGSCHSIHGGSHPSLIAVEDI